MPDKDKSKEKRNRSLINQQLDSLRNNMDDLRRARGKPQVRDLYQFTYPDPPRERSA